MWCLLVLDTYSKHFTIVNVSCLKQHHEVSNFIIPILLIYTHLLITQLAHELWFHSSSLISEFLYCCLSPKKHILRFYPSNK
jgi:hypothetical protein